MEKVHSNSKQHDGGGGENSEVLNEVTCDDRPLCESPILRISTKAGRWHASPDEEIRNYQLPRSPKRFSDMSEGQERVLPISPVITPPTVKRRNFKTPLVHTIGTVIKRKSGKKRSVSSGMFDDLTPVNVPDTRESVFDDVIADKDFSWDSSMETPLGRSLALNDYNTIERATFFPDSELKNVQPRVLFSPHKNNEIDCLPLKYSSESEEEKDKNPKEIQNSRICESGELLVELPKSGTALQPQAITECKSDDVQETENGHQSREDCERYIGTSSNSPVLQVKTAKGSAKAKPYKFVLVRSPVFDGKNHSSCYDGEKVNSGPNTTSELTLDEINTSESKCNDCVSEDMNSLQDDSFQNMSFSGIDELCRKSIDDFNSTKGSNFSGAEAEESYRERGANESLKDSSFGKEDIPRKISYYESSQGSELRPLPSVKRVLNRWKRFENVKTIEGKVARTVPNRGFTVFSKMMNDDVSESESTSKESLKRGRSEVSKNGEMSPSFAHKTKYQKLCSTKGRNKPSNSDGGREVKLTSQSVDSSRDFSSHFDDDDLDIYMSAAYAESLVLNQDSVHSGDVSGSVNGDLRSLISKSVDKLAEEEQSECHGIEAENVPESGIPLFTTATGKAIAVSRQAYTKAKALMEDEGEENDGDSSADFGEDDKENDLASSFKGFSTASGRSIKISKESLDKVKNMFADLEADSVNVSGGTKDSTRENLEKKMKRSPKENGKAETGFVGFRTALGRTVHVSQKSLDKVKTMFANLEVDSVDVSIGTHSEPGKNMEDRVKESPEKNGQTEADFVGFRTASGQSIKISQKSLDKAKFMFADLEVDSPDVGEGGKDSICRNVEVDRTRPPKRNGEAESFEGFRTALGRTVQVSQRSLDKVKTMFADLDANSRDVEEAKDSGCPGTVEEKLEESPRKSGKAETSFMGFRTALGQSVQVSQKSLDKVKTMFADLDVDSLDDEGKKDSGCPETVEKKLEESPRENGKAETGFVGFKTASNKSVVVSKKSVRMARSLWKGEEEVEEDASPSLPSGNERRIIGDPPDPKSEERDTQPGSDFVGFSTASGNGIPVSEESLSKMRNCFGEGEGDEAELHQPNSLGGDDGIPLEEDSALVEEFTGDDSLLIPSWLHVYSTSPNLTMDRTDMEAVLVHEDCQRHSTPKEEYIVKSPILEATDRFYSRRERKAQRKRLVFDEPPKPEGQSDHETPKRSFKAPFKTGAGSTKRSSSHLDIDFAVPFKRRRTEESSVEEVQVTERNSLTEEVIAGRAKARQEQELAGKREGKEKPKKGSHLLKKKALQEAFREAVRGQPPENHPRELLTKFGVREDVSEITVSNALEYRFNCFDFYTSSACFSNTNGFPVGDGCSLIFADDNTAGAEDFARAFLASPGVQPNLISDAWVKNHYRWIVWKLSHYERSFPHVFGGRCLNPHNVLVQLKYRYDREIDRSERSSLKKILERDESSTHRMVLCVTDVKKTVRLQNDSTDSSSFNNNSGSSSTAPFSYNLGLSDGWYNCYARTDPAMTRLIECGKVAVGTKLITQGAELLNCDKGISPLEADDKVHLKISTNSTRRVKWDTKLGFQRNGGPLLVSLKSILPNGGPVGRIDVVVLRVYPVLYMETKSDGSHVTRNSRMEDKAAAEYQQQREVAIENIYQKAKADMENRKKAKEKTKMNLPISNVQKVTDPEELHRLYENCSDPCALQNLLTADQKEILIEYRRQMNENEKKQLSELVREKMRNEKVNDRNVRRLLRVKVFDLHNSGCINPAQFTVWNVTEDISRLLSEGKAFSIYNVTPSGSRYIQPVQLNSTRQTQYRELKKTVDYPARRVTRLDEFTSQYEALLNEVDFVGLVVKIHEKYYGSRLSQTIILADANLNFVGIVFWGSCKEFGWENILTVGTVVACSNLQWKARRSSPQGIPSVYVSELSVFTENPRQDHLKEELQRLRSSLPNDTKTFISQCEDEIAEKLDETQTTSASYLSSNSLPSAASRPSLRRCFKRKAVADLVMKPTASSTPSKPLPAVADAGEEEQEPSPIQKRTEGPQHPLARPLSPLLQMTNSARLRRRFKAPFKRPSPAADFSAK